MLVISIIFKIHFNNSLLFRAKFLRKLVKSCYDIYLKIVLKLQNVIVFVVVVVVVAVVVVVVVIKTCGVTSFRCD